MSDLYAVKNLTFEIKRQAELLQELRFSLGVGGIRYDKPRVQVSANPDRFIYKLANISDQEEALKDLQKKLLVARRDLAKDIARLDNEKYKIILTSLYVDLNDLETTAKRAGLSYNYTCHLHRPAVAAFKVLYSNASYLPI